MSSSQQEFEQCKIQLRDNIKTLIKSNCLQEAQALIDEYEAIISNDVDIQLLKSRIKARSRSSCVELIEVNTDKIEILQNEEDVISIRNAIKTEFSGAEVPLVTIYVVAYNNLEKYTKTCIECILKYTKNVDYELILVDNGSSDGTFEYFQTVAHPMKKIIRVTKNIGAFFGGNEAYKIATGRFIVGVSIDVFVTQNWLVNMLRCALSDEKIGMIVPMSDYVSNLQSVDLGFKTFSEMQAKASEFNGSDPRKWHERVRLIPVVSFFSRVCLDMIGLQDYGFFHDFGDDDLTFRVRRAGYKAILCKDVFVQHAGGFKSSEEYQSSLMKGRDVFRKKYYGIDAWDDVGNFEPTMTSYVEKKETFDIAPPSVLGVDVLCGTPILEVKNRLREEGIFDVDLAAFSSEAKYWLDLQTICNRDVVVDRPEFIADHFKCEKFDFIVVGKPINQYADFYKMVERLLAFLNIQGQLILKVRNTNDITRLFTIMGIETHETNDAFQGVAIDRFVEKINSYDCCQVTKLMLEQYSLDQATSQQIRSMNNLNNDEVYSRAITKDYVLNIVKLSR